jgi:uncharacterized membrane protein
MQRFCPSCGLPLPEGSSACTSCRVTVAPFAGPGTATVTTGLTDNLAGALAYVTILPAIGFLLLVPYNKNRFVRFHSFQCIFLNIAWLVLWFGLSVVPLLGWVGFLLLPLLGFIGLILGIVLIIKAYQGQTFKLPVIGDLAEKYANNA